MYQILNISIITVSEAKQGNRIILDRKTLYHSSVKNNTSRRILQELANPTKVHKRINYGQKVK